MEKDIKDAQERAKKLKLFVHDIHGVLTSNTLFCDIEGRRQYGFWHMDGFGDLSLTANGIGIAFLDTTSIDGEGLFRAKELKLDKFYYSVTDKARKLDELTKEMNITGAEVGCLGCELTDIPVMKKAGLAVATADAIGEVKAIAHYITNAPGGRGAMREMCEFILRAMGKWDGWVEKVTKMGYK
ncbi:MAG: HAD hydrolase family protein [Syntrophorhabdales bacterium]|jgi:3-deoxy-D-manno-octulosonate 8-phosphate phosphatase (KDO 8-P phosphatase)